MVKDYKEYCEKRNKQILLLIFLLMIVVMIIFGFGMLRYKIMYHKAIELGAENTLVALEMVAACSTLGNISMEDIQDKTIEMFILNRGS